MNISKGVVARAQRVVVYGPEGIGKSTFAAQFPEPLFIDTEGSTDNMDVSRMDKPSSWTMLLNQVSFIKSNPTVCKTLIIDTADWAETLCKNHLMSTNGWNAIDSSDYGIRYVALGTEWGKFLDKLSELVDLGINIVITAHAMMRKFEQPDEMGAYDRWELKLEKKVAPLCKEWADMVLFFNYKTIVVTDDKTKSKKAQGGQRVMYTQHHPAWDAKNRFNLDMELPMDYGKIAHIFNKQSKTKEEVSQHTPPDSQQKQIEFESTTENPFKQEELLATENIPNAFVDVTGVPKNLADLMTENRVTKQQIEQVVALKGYFPQGTKIETYPEEFINAVLVSAWDQVYQLIIDQSLPF